MFDQPKISARSKKRLHEQGYDKLSDYELVAHRFGIRFAYVICMGLVAAGLIFSSQTLLLIANGVALLGVLPPYHPVDYFYNYAFRFFVGRPKLPPRANQGRFACYLATAILAVMNYYFYMGNIVVVYIVGAMLLTSAFMVGFFDLCIPSKIYNAIFTKTKKQTHPKAQIAQKNNY